MIKRRRLKKLLSLNECLEREAARLRARSENLAKGPERLRTAAEQAALIRDLATNGIVGAHE